MKSVAIVGSTGSIGQSALAVVDEHLDRLRVVALAAGNNARLMADQIRQYAPSRAAMAIASGAQELRGHLASAGTAAPDALLDGTDGLLAVATHPDADIVLFASSGTSSLDAVLAAIDAGKTIALANKEILVMAGSVVMAAASRRGITVLPVDSEHNAIHQCLHGRDTADVTRLILTASGGPFRGRPASELPHVRPEDALRHPTWKMGPKITIDSATLMNKGLEVIEARWLFDVGADRIDVVVHPQSIVHSMVEMRDGSVIAQLGVTDMRLPIQYAFSYPERWRAPLPPLDLVRAGRLDFEAVDTARFRCLALAFRALRGAEGLAIVLNAANEIAVSAFLEHRVPFPAIAALIEQSMDEYERQGSRPVTGLADVRAVDAWARQYASVAAAGVQSPR